MRQIDAGENLGAFGNAGQPFVQDLRIEMIEMQIDMILVLADAAAFADLDGHGARDHVARREILHRRRIALHEALALGIGEIAAFAARALGDEAAGAIDAGRMELHEFHVLQRQTGAQHHGIAVARAGMRRGRREKGAAIAARRQDDELRAEAMDRAVIELQADDAAAAAVLHDEIDREDIR